MNVLRRCERPSSYITTPGQRLNVAIERAHTCRLYQAMCMVSIAHSALTPARATATMG